MSKIPRRSNVQTDPEVASKRRSDPASTSGDGIEETFYVQNSEKRSLILGSEPPPQNPNKLHKGKNNIFDSTDTLYSEKQCRICHSGRDHPRNPLISPCKCSGTMKFVHIACLIRWLEVSSQKFWPTNECELCGYKFKRHPVWRIRRIRWPSSTYQDKVLNYLFLILLCLMFFCGTIASKYSHDAEYSRYKASRVVKIGNAFFSGDELMVVAAGFLFFMCFIFALLTQYRAGGTVFRQCVRFWTINRNWQIKNYSPPRSPSVLPISVVSGNTSESQ